MVAISVLLIAWFNARAQDDAVESITKAIEESDIKSLSAFFYLTIELSLPGNENSYSSTQAEMIMKDFFRKCPPDSFKIVQKGSTDAISMFLIGDYLSASKKYQVYIHLRKEKEKYLIQKLRFDENKQ